MCGTVAMGAVAVVHTYEGKGSVMLKQKTGVIHGGHKLTGTLAARSGECVVRATDIAGFASLSYRACERILRKRNRRKGELHNKRTVMTNLCWRILVLKCLC